jgi:hypothetical protein
MAKATQAVNRVAATRKTGGPFSLNAEARRFLRAHEVHQAAERAFRTAAEAEEASGRDLERDDCTPATVALHGKWHAARRQMVQMSNAIAARSAQKRRPALADCLLLALASWYSDKAHGPCGLALLTVAGIDMDDGCSAARGLDL